MTKNIFHTCIANIFRLLTASVRMLLLPIKYMLYRFIGLIKKIIRKTINSYELLLSQKKHIISSDQFGESILQLKEKSVEKTFSPKIYNLAEESWVNIFFPKLEVRKFIDVQVYSESDFIITKDGAIWDKFFKPQWTKIIPLDKSLLKIKDNYIFIKKAKKIIPVEYGFSLCGVHSTIWTHFLVQYLPKLYLLKEILSVISHDLTIIVPHYKDIQIREIVYSYLSQFKNIKVMELERNDVANCKVLYFIENTSYISDDTNYINPSDYIIPCFSLELLKNNLINRFTDNFQKNKDSTQLPFRKLYIGRSDSGYRNVLNNAEIEQYFVSLEFEVIQPHNLTLIEKVKIFREAAIIVGPYAGGFTNIIFCQPRAKALLFVNYQRTFDGFISTLAKYFDVDIMHVTGYDQNDSIHSSYHVPLDKIKSAYLELLS